MNFHEPIPLPSRLGQADRDTVTNTERSSLFKTRRAGTSAMVEGFRRSTRQHLRTPGQSCLVNCQVKKEISMQATRRISASLGGPSCLALSSLLIWIPLSLGLSAHAQSSPQQPEQGSEVLAAAPTMIPQQVRYAGKLATRSGETVEAVFSIYAAPEGGEPLWTETQQVAVAPDGSYAVLLGGASPAGLPQSLFAGGTARWLGVSVERAPELERMLLSSVPYSMKSADAELLSGHTTADFVTQEQFAAMSRTVAAQAAQATLPNVTPSGSGTADYLPIWTNSTTLGNSNAYQSGSNIGIGTTTPKFLVTIGNTTYATVPTATLGMRGAFYVQNTGFGAGAIFNRTDGAQLILGGGTSAGLTYDASHSLLIGHSLSSTILGGSVAPTTTVMALTPAGNVGIGTATPAATLEVNGTGKFDGLVTFAAAQTFPGTGTIKGITTSSPLTGSGTSGSVALGLNETTLVTDITPSLETTLDPRYARLAVGDIFSSYLEAYQTSGPGNAAVLGWGSSGSVGTFGDSDTGFGLQGESTSGHGVYAQVTTPAAGSSGVLGFTGTAFSSSYTSEASIANAGVWADNSAAGTGFPVSLFATGDDVYGGAIVTNGPDYPALFVDNNGGTGGEFEASKGYGV